MTKTAKQTLGARLHLLRLELGWSEHECAYRLTIEANALITPEEWIAWERSQERDPQDQVLHHRLTHIATVFGVDPEWLLQGEDPIFEQPTPKVLTLRSD